MVRTLWLALGKLLLVAALVTGTSAAHAADGAASPPLDRTLSPFFVVEGADPSLDGFPLESTNVAVRVSGTIAEVTVTQAYRNAGKKPLNAEYVFPASTRAAVHGLQMKVRDQLITARIQEKKQATKTFEAAKKSGKSATLLEQQRPNVFTMKVANVMPGDRIEVALRYSELLVPTAGEYEFVYPTVVGPRYSNTAAAAAPPNGKFVATPYTAQGKAPSYTLAISGTLATPIPLQSLTSPSHAITSTALSAGVSNFNLAPSESAGANRDFILHYRLSGAAIQSGLMLFDAGSEKFFLLQVEPPQRVRPEQMPPREYVFVLDVSGSMSGFPLDTAKKLMRELAAGLRPIDRFNVLLFSGASELLAERSLPATPANVALATRFVEAERGGGGTELLPALERALSLTKNEGISRSFIIVTDGYIEQDKGAIDLVRSRLGDANVFSFGIGSSVNRYLIEGLAKAGAGEPFIVTDPAQAPATAARLRDYVRSPVLTDIALDYEGFAAYDVEPKSFPDLLAERPLVIHGKYRGEAKGVLRLRGLTGTGTYEQRFDVSQVKSRPEQSALAFLWARSRVASLSDFGFGTPTPSVQAEITNLGLRYDLLTQYTSFVAVAERVVNPGAPASDVKQPLPLPDGVSNLAIAEEPNSADEPGLVVLLALLGLAWGASQLSGKRREARAQ